MHLSIPLHKDLFHFHVLPFNQTGQSVIDLKIVISGDKQKISALPLDIEGSKKNTQK